MPCYYPSPSWLTPGGDVVFKRPIKGKFMRLPCGGCLGCRTSYRREWAIRVKLEADAPRCNCSSLLCDKLHYGNTWGLLSYHNNCLPHTLIKADLANFIKRLRAAMHPRKLRHFCCGEYGEREGRPHYHHILFGLRHDDPRTRELVEQSWGMGYTSCLQLSDKAISYVAGYVAQKLNQYDITQYDTDPATGAPWAGPDRHNHIKYQAPFIQMSRRPGIAAWAKKEYAASWRNTARYAGLNVPAPRYLNQGWIDSVTQPEVEQLKEEKRNKRKPNTPKMRQAQELIRIAQQRLQATRRTKT